MESTIAGSTNACSEPTNSYEGRIYWLKTINLRTKNITNMSNRFDINWTFLKFNNFRGRPE